MPSLVRRKPAGLKRTGACRLPVPLVAELKFQAGGRSPSDYLLLSPWGARLDVLNLAHRVFLPAATLAFVKLNWPHGAPEARLASPYEVASSLWLKEGFKFDGVPPRDPEKVKARAAKLAAIAELRRQLQPIVTSKLKNRPQYAFIRKTHKTLAAKAGVPKEARDIQQGHAPKEHGRDLSGCGPHEPIGVGRGGLERDPEAGGCEGRSRSAQARRWRRITAPRSQS